MLPRDFVLNVAGQNDGNSAVNSRIVHERLNFSTQLSTNLLPNGRALGGLANENEVGPFGWADIGKVGVSSELFYVTVSHDLGHHGDYAASPPRTSHTGAKSA